MIHRVVFGSVERFIGVLTEHYAGAFPLWLAPEQIRIMPITDRTNDYAEKIKAALVEKGFRPRPTCAMRRSATRSARPRARRSPT